MAGHSKWANIKHKKALQDKKKGKLFTKILKEISVAAQINPDPEANPRLRAAIHLAKKNSLPKDNIEKALKKDQDKSQLQEVVYEAYGPNGIGLIIQCATDNLTRTVANIRSYLNKYEGSLAKDGALNFVFETKALFILYEKEISQDLELKMMEKGLEEIENQEDHLYCTVDRDYFGEFHELVEKEDLQLEEASLEKIPLLKKEITPEMNIKFEKLLQALEDDHDVQEVYHNAVVSI